MSQHVDAVEAQQQKDELPPLEVGDTVGVHYRVVHKDSSRIQVFRGVVIRIKGGTGVRATFTVRRLVSGEGVERTFPLHSPRVEAVEIERHGQVRRAKLYYLRGLTGKAARLRERLPKGRRG